MFHSCKIKLGGITNLSDARYAAAAYAEWVGFCFIPGHVRYITPMKAKEIIDWLSGPVVVAEIGPLNPQENAPALQVLGISTVQVAGIDNAGLWKDAGFEVILEGTAQQREFIRLIHEIPTAAQADSAIVDITGMSHEQILQVKSLQPLGIQLIGGDEPGPGLRDFSEIDEILELFSLDL